MNAFQTEDTVRDDGNIMGKDVPSGGKDAVFHLEPLTPRERTELGISGYYRPYMNTLAVGHDPYTPVKRVLDVVLCVIALFCLSPLLVICMVAIYLEDPVESPIFRQTRIGQDGKKFVMYKLRSMYAGSDKRFKEYQKHNEAQSKAFKMRNDPRITRVGRVMRKLSIDELPQLLNVIKGDMSIVGPRPPLPWEVEQYDSYDLQRLSIRPGLTCHWQIHPRRHGISFEDWVALDIKYIQHHNIFVDVSLIMKTVLAIVKGNGD